MLKRKRLNLYHNSFNLFAQNYNIGESLHDSAKLMSGINLLMEAGKPFDECWNMKENNIIYDTTGANHKAIYNKYYRDNINDYENETWSVRKSDSVYYNIYMLKHHMVCP